MDQVNELVLGPFRDIVAKGRLAAENAAEAQPAMLRASQSLIKEGTRALRKLDPVCSRYLDEYGEAFIDALKGNDVLSEMRQQLVDLLWEFDDYIEPDVFEASKFAELQARSRTIGPDMLEVLTRMKVTCAPPAPADPPPPLPPPPQLTAAACIESLRALPPPATSSHRPSSSEPDFSESERDLHPPTPPSENPWDLNKVYTRDEIRSIPEPSPPFQRRPDVPIPPPLGSPLREGAAHAIRRHDSGSSASAPPSPWPAQPSLGETHHGLSPDTPMIPEDWPLLASHHHRQSKYFSPDSITRTGSTDSAPQNRISDISSVGSIGVRARSLAMRDQRAAAAAPAGFGQPLPPLDLQGPRLGTPLPLFDDDGRRYSATGLELAESVAAAAPIMTGARPRQAATVAVVPAAAAAAVAAAAPPPPPSPTPLAPPADCTIGVASSFALHKGWCAGAKELYKGGLGVKKVKKHSLEGVYFVGKCVACAFEFKFDDIERDVTRRAEATLEQHGIRYRPRFLQKSHLPAKKADEPVYGCMFCVQVGRTMEESDGTVFFTQDGLFGHIARHRRPLPQVEGVVVLHGEEIPPHLVNDFDLHVRGPTKRSIMSNKTQMLARLPRATARETVRSSDIPVGARIVGIEFSERGAGEVWCTGWYDGGSVSIPFEATVLEPPSAQQLAVVSRFSNVRAVAKWRFVAQKDKSKQSGDGGAGWLKLDKDEIITNIHWVGRDHWCWSGTNSKGKWGVFPQTFLDPRSIQDLSGTVDDRCSILSSGSGSGTGSTDDRKRSRLSFRRTPPVRTPSNAESVVASPTAMTAARQWTAAAGRDGGKDDWPETPASPRML